MRHPTNAFDMRVYDTYWALNRAHKGLHVALTLPSDTKWKDCQKAASLAEEKVEDAIEIAKSLPTEAQGWMARLREIRLHASKAAAAQNPEKMKMALMQALRLTMETEEVIRRFYRKKSKPSKRQPSYRVTRKQTKQKDSHKSKPRTLRKRFHASR